jgi:hypothetical protein
MNSLNQVRLENIVFLHETKKENIENIFRFGLRLSSEVLHVEGQGPVQKRLTNNPRYFETHGTNDVQVDQVDAVYFTAIDGRKFETFFGKEKNKFAYFVLNSEWLKNHSRWYFNSAENHGFSFNGISPWSGNPGRTLFTIESILNETDFSNIDNELVVLENVPPHHLSLFL